MVEKTRYDVKFSPDDARLEHPDESEARLVDESIYDAWHTDIDSKTIEEWASEAKILADEVLRLRYTVQQERLAASETLKTIERRATGPDLHVIEALVQAERTHAEGVGPRQEESLRVVIQELRTALGLNHA